MISPISSPIKQVQSRLPNIFMKHPVNMDPTKSLNPLLNDDF